MSNLIASWFNSPVQENSNILTKFISHNNTPVNQFCANVPITQPSFISTLFGQSIMSLAVLVFYYILYRREDNRTGVEDRLLFSLIVGNVIYSTLAFNDYFNLTQAIINCNDYKNGAVNLYTVSRAIDQGTLINTTALSCSHLYENFYDYLFEFMNYIQNSLVSFAEKMNHVLTYGYIDLVKKL
ncbi:hypothetical protein WICPIJ_000247 [Wickerhamomyces pijperi]|uniref:Uncharacterized protein n=1 Tax=Wickerhamomyces pijperi TaxID=599730 RepID=A0A9P8TS28_WICPI|nr:hypothetical protein WICPIJ_000247 [Wickerhamomyces pijperi]